MTFKKKIVRIIPPGDNLGLYSISLLGVGGNSSASQQLEYLAPAQEVAVGKSAVAEVFVIDNIIKKEL